VHYDGVLVKILRICISYFPNSYTFKNSVGENDVQGSWMKHLLVTSEGFSLFVVRRTLRALKILS